MVEKKYYSQEEIDNAKIWAFDLHSFNKKEIQEELKDCFVVFYGDLETIYLFKSSKIKELDREDFVNSFIRKVQMGTNYSRKIVAVSGNIYFVY